MSNVATQCTITLLAEDSPFATLGESKGLIRQAAWQFYMSLMDFPVLSYDRLEFSDPTDTGLEISVDYRTLNFVTSGATTLAIIEFFKTWHKNTGIDASFTFIHTVI